MIENHFSGRIELLWWRKPGSLSPLKKYKTYGQIKAFYTSFLLGLSL